MLLVNAGMGLQLANWDIWSHPNPPQTAARWISSDTWMLVSPLHAFLAFTIKNKNFLTAHIIGRSCSYSILLLKMQHSYMKIKAKRFRWNGRVLREQLPGEHCQMGKIYWAGSHGISLGLGSDLFSIFINNLDERVESPFVEFQLRARDTREEGISAQEISVIRGMVWKGTGCNLVKTSTNLHLCWNNQLHRHTVGARSQIKLCCKGGPDGAMTQLWKEGTLGWVGQMEMLHVGCGG